jgi:hypothetical protein
MIYCHPLLERVESFMTPIEIEVSEKITMEEIEHQERIRGTDKVNPTHYQGKDGVQVMDVIEMFNLDYCLGNAAKYILRAGKKNGESEVTDLEKARWYLNRRIEQLKIEEASK